MMHTDHDVRAKMLACQINWGTKAPVHVNSAFYGIGDRDPSTWIALFEWHGLGELEGRNVWHLRSLLGCETMAFALKGAHTTGLDSSGVSVLEEQRTPSGHNH